MLGSKIQLKSPEQIVAMRRAGLVVANGLAAMGRQVRAGVTTSQIEQAGAQVIKDAGATSNFYNYGAQWGMSPFPATACISAGEVVVHGIPGSRALVDGEIVSVDFGAIVAGWHGDAARTFPVGTISPEVAALSEVTRLAMWAGIAAAWTGRRVADVSRAIEQTALDGEIEVGIVREFTGHGIGTRMHMAPDVPNYAPRGRTPRLAPGMCLAIEPIFTLGTPQTRELADEWTVVTADGKMAAHWENTVAILADGLWVLTEPDGGRAELEARGVPVSKLADKHE